MQRNMTILASLVVVAGVGAIGCSSTSGPADAAPPTPVDPSFANDVMPILQQGCTISTVCHGQMGNSGEENLYLGKHQTSLDGKPVDPAVAMMVNAGIVSKPSLEDPSMNLITPMDPANSLHLAQAERRPGHRSRPSAQRACATAPRVRHRRRAACRCRWPPARRCRTPARDHQGLDHGRRQEQLRSARDDRRFVALGGRSFYP